ncbi:MAG: isoprenylcysteine carboxylmethyltransferase family protein [Deltaproteobacteria bacterium]|nr:isoprenylcysteine carboxylmethyltransferase family protein [Deltaproteobacteria bacterium]NNG47977.1 isoprenylcysteine carboxylmethyltransferase family protein [Deltaproteobacteria bacterium]
MSHQDSAYGLWILVLITSAVFLFFAYRFARPTTRRDWRSFGAFSAFIVALFAEMYGFPLTIYLLSGWIQRRYPGLDLFSHESGHLWNTMLGFQGDPHTTPIHILSYVLILAGFIILRSAWKVLYAAQRERRLATTGAYARVRHPQYAGFILIMLGFLFQWPTLLTLLMFPVLVYMYYRLALREESDSREAFGEAWDEYAARTPRFFPRLASAPPGGISEAHIGREGGTPMRYPNAESRRRRLQIWLMK